MTDSTLQPPSRRHAALLDAAGVRTAVASAFAKLAPQHAFRNPVMAVVWLGTLLTAGLTLAGTTTPGIGWAVTALLFVTVLFANFAEAMAEGRSKAQASALRGMKKKTIAKNAPAGRV